MEKTVEILNRHKTPPAFNAAAFSGDGDKWVTEIDRDMAVSYRIKDRIFKKQSQYQGIEIFESQSHGKIMTLDGIVMLTEREEFTYHEMLAHVPLSAHPCPENVLVIGGGDGGIVREVLKHNCVKQVDFVEIDRDVADASRVYLKKMWYDESDKRVSAYYEDGVEYVKKKENFYDAAIIDCTDPSQISEGLFSRDFYLSLKRALKKNAVFATQSQSPFYDAEFIKKLHAGLRDIFVYVRLYLAHVPFYPGGCWSFTCVSDTFEPSVVRKVKYGRLGTLYYNEYLHKSAFVLPEFVNKIVSG